MNIAILALLLAAPAVGPRVLVLEDFEDPGAAARWEGQAEISGERAAHGQSAARVRLDRDHPQFSSARLAADWSGYERLLFDIYSQRESVSTATLRIHDAAGGDARNEYFDARNKIFLQPGWNHVEVRLTPLKAATYERDMALDRIRRLAVSADPPSLPWTIWVDNIRLVSGEEAPPTASRLQPQDSVTLIDNRWVTVRQVARPEDVPQSPEVTALRRQAEQERTLLGKAIDAARTQGVETIYAERHLVTADLGLTVRPLLAWFNNDGKKREMFSYVRDSCRRGRQELEDLLRGTAPRREADDTQTGDPLVRPLPPLKGRPAKGMFFLDERAEPLMVLSLHSPSRLLQRFFASPWQHIESYTVGGGSRWTIDTSPVYAAFQEDAETHRVGWDGWCGHLIRDLDSMGGTKKENVVICLESPRTRKAVAEYIRTSVPEFHAHPDLLYDIMAYELMYMCYCDRSRASFHEWLARKHGGIERANQCWGTDYRRFADVVPPPVKNSRPLPGTNRGLWYDWARFNQDRFTDYLLWTRNEIRQIDATVPLAAGGSSSMLAGRTGTTGIDEERIVNEVGDLIIHEGGGPTLGMDLQLALSESKKPLADPEMSLGSVEYLLPHFLHGKSVAQLYHWPAQPANEFHSNNRSSLAHSWTYPLADVGELLRVALDVRRLNQEIAAFAGAPAQVAILYSQTSTLQLPPEMLTWQVTPYLAELQKTYAASQYLDAKVTFITERQIRKGWLSRYRLLLAPAVRNLPADVVGQIREYASAGGRVFVTPESLLGDEYNRRADYLAKLGITVRETFRPQAAGGGRMVQGYDQSFSEDVAFDDGVPLKLSPGALESRGVRQTIELSGKAGVLHRRPDGSPAIVRVALGRGAIDYAACSLEEQSFARLLDPLFTEAGVDRAARVVALDGAGKWRVEARFARLGPRRLLYVSNFNPRPIRLRVEAPLIAGLEELRDQRAIRGGEIEVPARQTGIYELR
ncbi:MAG: beta-galactosidase [Acidobacteria bacterium]|nr:beta-galactosidase [Acidobacteriota bacterium]